MSIFIDKHALAELARQQWQSRADVRAEFRGNEAAHAAFLRAEAAGLTRGRDGQARAAQAIERTRATARQPMPAPPRQQPAPGQAGAVAQPMTASAEDIALASTVIRAGLPIADKAAIREARGRVPSELWIAAATRGVR